MSVLWASHASDLSTAEAWAVASSIEPNTAGGPWIAFRVASRITHVPSGAQYSCETLRITMTRAERRTDLRYSHAASRAE